METQPRVIDWSTLAIAFRNNAPGNHAYLDLVAGRVLMLQSKLPRDRAMLQRISEQPGCFVRLQPASTREQPGWMVGFTVTVEDPELRIKLTQALEDAGAFRRFKQVLAGDPSEHQRWLELRARLLRVHIERRLGSHGITVSEPPNGSAKLMGATNIVISEQGLRRIAFGQIERLPTSALQSVIDFLRYLDVRGR